MINIEDALNQKTIVDVRPIVKPDPATPVMAVIVTKINAPAITEALA
jgi:hypothetical protein